MCNENQLNKELSNGVKLETSKRCTDETEFRLLSALLKKGVYFEFGNKLKEMKNILDSSVGTYVYQFELANIFNAIVRGCSDIVELCETMGEYNQMYETIASCKDIDEVMSKLFMYAQIVMQINNKRYGVGSTDSHRTIADYLDANFTKPALNMDELSQAVCLSPSYISSILKKRSTSFVKYITTQRIELAKKLLRYKNSTISDIAHEVGFADAYYFSRCFRKYTGMSPKQYKAQVVKI